MGALDRYLLRRLATAFAIVFLGVVGLAATLDLLANADEAIQSAINAGSGAGLGSYLLARIPLIALKLAPIAALLAALTTLLTLTRTGEMGAAAALGASRGRIARALLPAAIALGASLFLIGEFVAPPAASKLRDMGLDPFSRVVRPTDAVWLREATDVVRIGHVSADENTLADVTIFRRDGDGRLAYEIRAKRAERESPGWRLLDVTVLASDASPPERGSLMVWPTSLGPQSYRTLAAHPQELDLPTIRNLAALPGASPKPTYYYDLWIQRRFAGPISAALMLMLAIPFAGGLARGRSMAGPLAAGVVAGFAYFVLENLAIAAGEGGAMAPTAAAWGPPATLAFLILTLAAFQEKPG